MRQPNLKDAVERREESVQTQLGILGTRLRVAQPCRDECMYVCMYVYMY